MNTIQIRAAAAALGLASMFTFGIVAAGSAPASVTWCQPGYQLITVGNVTTCQWVGFPERRHAVSHAGTADSGQ